MSTEQRQPAPPRKAEKPFSFNTSEHLMRIGTTWCALEINLLQQASRLVIQKSLKEGFGLTVTEALWKGKPTIAGAVGGIPNQIIPKLTGVLVHSVEGCAFQIRYLLTHPEFARRIGMNGREHVRENFLITSDVKRWLLLFRTLCGQQPARAWMDAATGSIISSPSSGRRFSCHSLRASE